jgi:hypothetical protein
MPSPPRSWIENGESVFHFARPGERDAQNDITSMFNVLERDGNSALLAIRPGPMRSRRVQPKSTAREFNRGNLSSFKLQGSKMINSENSSASLVRAFSPGSSKVSEARPLRNPRKSLPEKVHDDGCQVVAPCAVRNSNKAHRNLPFQPIRELPIYMVPIVLSQVTEVSNPRVCWNPWPNTGSSRLSRDVYGARRDFI